MIESKLLASTSYDNTIRLWEEGQSDWYCRDILIGHESTVWAADFSPDGKYLASVGQDGTLRLWTAKSNGGSDASNRYQCTSISRGRDGNECIYSVSWSRANDLIATGSASGTIKIFETGEQSINEILCVPNSHGYFEVNCVEWCPHSEKNCDNLLLSAGDDCIVRLWRYTPSSSPGTGGLCKT